MLVKEEQRYGDVRRLDIIRNLQGHDPQVKTPYRQLTFDQITTWIQKHHLK